MGFTGISELRRQFPSIEHEKNKNSFVAEGVK
jgi:hypothetical protein